MTDNIVNKRQLDTNIGDARKIFVLVSRFIGSIHDLYTRESFSTLRCSGEKRARASENIFTRTAAMGCDNTADDERKASLETFYLGQNEK